MKALLNRARQAAGQVGESVSDATSAALAVIPSANELKRGMGQALILGGRTLIDPRAVIGEVAVGLGQSLVGDASARPWLVLVPDGDGFAVIGRGTEAQAREFLRLAVAEGKPALLCQVFAAADPDIGLRPGV